MKKRRLDIALVSLTGLTVLSVLGSSLGTLAWYAYSTKVTVSYQGTAVAKTEQLQIGLKWDRSTTDSVATKFHTDFGTERYETIGTDNYVFMPAGSGFSNLALNEYLNIHGRATSKLPPITTNVYDGQSTTGTTALTKLYQSPTYSHENVNQEASSSYYVELPFIFRVLNGEQKMVQNADIWLTDVHAEATVSEASSVNVAKALRVYCHKYNTDTGAEGSATALGAVDYFLLNPADTDASGKGSTYVAGLLDLDKDGYYDYNLSTHKEYIYGVKGETLPATTTFTADTLADINSTNPGENAPLTTFYAKHKKDVTGYSNYTISGGTADVRGVQKYVTFNGVKPTQDPSTGLWSGGRPFAHTSNHASGAYARCDLKVFLEGWDHAIIDQLLESGGQGAAFNLGLQFEINQVQS